MIQLRVTQQFVGLRLDKFLCQKYDLSFAVAQKLLRQKKVKINSAKCDASYKLKDFDLVEIFSDLNKRSIDAAKSPAKVSSEKLQNFWQSKIYEDENLLVIDKPSGLAVQGGSGIDFFVDTVLSHLNLQQEIGKKFQLVHRLDKDTSGILLIAKNDECAQLLGAAFREKTIKKTYIALVNKILNKKQGIIDMPIGKKFVGKNEKVYRDEINGKQAVTHFTLLQNFNDYALVKLNPITGRTHQLRVHCKEIGHPIINDVKYGGKEVLRKDLCLNLALHAYRIEIDNFFGSRLDLTTKIPQRFFTESLRTIISSKIR